MPSISASCNQILLPLKRVGTIAAGKVVYVQIFSDSSDSPNAQIGSNSSNVAADTMDTSTGDRTFTFATPIALTSGTKYWIVLIGDYVIDTANNIWWSSDNTSPTYSYKGIALWNGSAWTTVTAGTTYAQNFKEYYDDTTVVIGIEEFAYFL